VSDPITDEERQAVARELTDPSGRLPPDWSWELSGVSRVLLDALVLSQRDLVAVRAEVERLRALTTEPFRDVEGNPDPYADLMNTEMRDQLITQLQYAMSIDTDPTLTREDVLLILGALRTVNEISGRRSSAAVDAELAAHAAKEGT